MDIHSCSTNTNASQNEIENTINIFIKELCRIVFISIYKYLKQGQCWFGVMVKDVVLESYAIPISFAIFLSSSSNVRRVEFVDIARARYRASYTVTLYFTAISIAFGARL